MYPTERLTALADRKALLLARIGIRRQVALDDIHRLGRTVAELAVWRARLVRWSLLGSVGAALAGIGRPRTENGSVPRWKKILRWAPLAMQALRLVKTVVRPL